MNLAADGIPANSQAPDRGMRARLRAATYQSHQQLESRLALGSGVWTTPRYCELLSAMLGIYRPLERQLTALNWHGSGIAIAERCKASWICADLAYFGYTTSVPQCDFAPSAPTVEDGLGILYVLEGSTLGGQLILRELQPQLNISPEFGGRFFSSYGKQISSMWRQYIEALDRYATVPQAADTIERSAIDTFRAFDRWLETTVRHPKMHAENYDA